MNNEVTFEITGIDKHKKATVKAYQDGSPVEIDRISLESRKSRKSFLNSVSEKTGLDTDMLNDIFIEHVHQLETQTQKQGKKDFLNDCPAVVKHEALEMLKNPNLFALIAKDIEKAGIAGEKDLCRQLYIIMSSRILDKPVSGIVFGASASGKSYLIETIAKMMPDEAVLQAHDITESALYYLEPGSLKNKIVIAGERIEDKRGKAGKAEDNTKALREVLASGKLSKVVTTKVEGQLVANRIEQEGPIVYLESTTSMTIHDEDATRLLPLVTDESSGQTQIIIGAMKAKALGQIADDRIKKTVLLKHKTAQRLLKPAKVIIPYVDSLNLPYDVVSTRRAFDQLLSMIKAVATLRQYQKDSKEENGVLILQADEVDYAIVYPLMMKIFSRTYSPMNEKSRDLLKIIIEHHPNNPFAILDLVSWSGISDASVRRRLRELVERGILSENRDQKPYTYTVDKPELAETADIDLAAPDEIAERSAIMGV